MECALILIRGKPTETWQEKARFARALVKPSQMQNSALAKGREKGGLAFKWWVARGVLCRLSGTRAVANGASGQALSLAYFGSHERLE